MVLRALSIILLKFGHPTLGTAMHVPFFCFFAFRCWLVELTFCCPLLCPTPPATPSALLSIPSSSLLLLSLSLLLTRHSHVSLRNTHQLLFCSSEHSDSQHGPLHRARKRGCVQARRHLRQQCRQLCVHPPHVIFKCICYPRLPNQYPSRTLHRIILMHEIMMRTLVLSPLQYMMECGSMLCSWACSVYRGSTRRHQLRHHLSGCLRQPRHGCGQPLREVILDPLKTFFCLSFEYKVGSMPSLES